MKILSQALSGLLYLEPKVLGDERGFFFESFHQKNFADIGIEVPWVQDNHSRSAKGVLRGLHFQKGTMAQDKLVRVVVGKAWDVVVDIRRSSPTFGKWAGFELSAANKRMVFIPKGFAHGFLSQEDGTEFLYKCSNYYDPASECGMIWNDPTVAVAWPLEGQKPQLSGRDERWGRLGDLASSEIFS